MGFFKDFAEKLNDIAEDANNAINNVMKNNKLSESENKTPKTTIRQKGVVKCENCGASLSPKTFELYTTCEYCGFKNINEISNSNAQKINVSSDKNTVTVDYPVLVHKEDSEGFMAYDLDLDLYSNYHDSVSEALSDIKIQIQNSWNGILEGGEEFEPITEEKLRLNKDAIKSLSQGDRIKTIQFSVNKKPDFNEDADW